MRQKSRAWYGVCGFLLISSLILTGCQKKPPAPQVDQPTEEQILQEKAAEAAEQERLKVQEEERERQAEAQRMEEERLKAEEEARLKAEEEDRLRAEAARMEKEKEALQTVYFDYDKALLKEGTKERLKVTAEWMEENSNLKILVEGHCDERGTSEYNLALGEKRAMAVKAYLAALGISGARVNTISYGEEMPAALGHDENSWSKNRRAQFQVVSR